MFFLTIFTAFAGTLICACDATLVTFTILFEASTLFAMASLRVLLGVLMYLGLECMRVSLHNGFHDFLPFLVVIFIAAVIAVALGTTALTEGKAIAIEFQAFRLLAVTSSASHAVGTFFVSLQEDDTLLI